MPPHWKKDVLKDPGGSLDTWRYTVCSQTQAGQRLKDMGLQSVRGQQEAPVMFGYFVHILVIMLSEEIIFQVLWKPGGFPVT